MKRLLFFFLVSLLLAPCSYLWAQVSLNPTATYYMTNEKGEEESDVITSDPNGDTPPLNAPVRIVFQANPSKPFPNGYSSDAHYNWTITNTLQTSSTPIVRDQEEFELTFSESGTYEARLNVIFYDETGKDIIYEFPEEGDDPKVLHFTISESQLVFPNAISPNDDGKNDVLKPKEGFKNIIDFHAKVFNRWGQRLYSWDDVHGSWDGKVGGKVVKDGVYFLVVSAKGSDGINYNIKKAINVISGYNNENASNSGDNE